LHRVTAQMLFVAQQGRPDLLTATSFLTKRVQSPDEDNYKKLACAIKYIHRTMFLRLTIEATYLDQNHGFIDGAFAVHEDMRSHTRAYITFGKGMINGSSKTQKINTTSSTEAEVIAVHENMPAILWTRYFLAAQGYPLKPSKLHQDNTSAELLQTNGRASSSKQTRHMNIRYFFVADVQKRNHVTIEHCPTDEMIGDFLPSHWGGAKFRRFCNIIMNINHDEHGSVDVDALMAVHNEKMKKKMEMSVPRENTDEYEPTICKNPSGTAGGDSQECVGDDMKRDTIKWANTRSAHKNIHGRTKRSKPTYAQVVSE